MTGRLARARAWLRRHIDNWSQTVSPHESDGTATDVKGGPSK